MERENWLALMMRRCWTVLMRGCLLVVIQLLVCLVTQLKDLCQLENQSSPLMAHNPAINSYTMDNC